MKTELKGTIGSTRHAMAMLAVSLVPALLQAQMLETETARPVGARHFKLETSYELQTSREGREIALPVVLEYGITSWLEIAAEPVPYNAILPKAGKGRTEPVIWR